MLTADPRAAIEAWRALVSRHQLDPDMQQYGPPSREVRFHGHAGGAWLVVGFRPGDRHEPVRVRMHRRRPSTLMGDHAFRVVPRRYVPGYTGGIGTGDPARDQRVLVLAEAFAAVAHLDATAWAAIDDLVGDGRAWLVDDAVGVDPRAALVPDVEAAEDLLRAGSRLLQILAACKAQR